MTVSKKLNVAVVGATGYTGLDLTFLLSNHPKINIVYLSATKNLGKSISFFDKRIKKKLPKISSIEKIDWNKLDLIFLSLPNGKAQSIINSTFNRYKKLKYIDLSADFRINDKKLYYKNYNIKHKAPDLIKDSLYSISEFVNDKIKNYRIIANPGCYPTSILLPLIPLIKKKLITPFNLTIDSKSGYSGAGKNLKKKFNHKNLYESTFAYGIKNHRHISEIDQEIYKLTNTKILYSFNPHLLPTFRGILSSIYLTIKKNKTPKCLRDELIKYYKNKKFIRIHKLNTPLGSGNVLNTNNCEISICQTRIKNKIVIFSALDNLVKGASGQAIQNMNLLYNFPKELGLK